jgi:hypothetical protein
MLKYVYSFYLKRNKIGMFIMTGRQGNIKKTVLSRKNRYVWSAYIYCIIYYTDLFEFS